MNQFGADRVQYAFNFRKFNKEKFESPAYEEK